MPYHPNKHHRRSIRLKGYDYAQPGHYFVTICTQHRFCHFGQTVQGQMQLNNAGRMVHETWDALPQRFPQIHTDAFVVMPNHLHGIIVLASDLPNAQVLGTVVGAFKSITTHAYIQGVRHRGWPRFDRRLWQRNYYERIIRNRYELDRARAYIHENPACWAYDRENPHRVT